MSAGKGPNDGLIRDSVTVYGRTTDIPYAYYPGFADARDIHQRPLDRSYAHFICADGGKGDAYKWFDGGIGSDPPDGDINFDIDISQFRHVEPYDNAVAASYLAPRPSDPGGLVHAEMIMYGRSADRDHCTDQVPSLLPGWADSDSNSVLLNGRPMNGQEASSNIRVSRFDPSGVPCDHTTGGGIYKSDSFSCLVTGVLDTTTRVGQIVRVNGVPAKDEHGGPGVEIHPVYSIDVVSAPPSTTLTGIWGDGGRTRGIYYIRQANSSVFWLGMSEDRGQSWISVFRGKPAASDQGVDVA